VKSVPGWGADDIGDLTGRTAVVTGANSGIGFQVALQLGAHGAHVVLACRSTVKAEHAADLIVGAEPEASVEVLSLDLASLASVRRAAARLSAEHARLDVLVNNAGVMATPSHQTEDGVELQIATNHLGPFAFTGLLLDTLLTTTGSRVVTVSSAVHHVGRLEPSPLVHDGRRNRWLRYGDSKLANLAFTFELDRRLRQAGTTTLAVVAHPGWARTDLVANGPLTGGGAISTRLGHLAGRLGQPAAMGALPVLYAATAPGVRGGDFFGPGGFGGMFGRPVPVTPGRRARDPRSAATLWHDSEELTGVYYAFAGPTGPTGPGRPGPTGDAAGRSRSPG
jgi:NAD(P)-dependent dehydrogenase (short-subunit alcohol dehydrogenase family)